MAIKEYKVLSGKHHVDGKAYAAGEIVRMDESEAESFAHLKRFQEIAPAAPLSKPGKCE